MATIRIPAPKRFNWVSQLGNLKNFGDLNRLIAEIPPGSDTKPVTETTGTSKPEIKEYASPILVFISYVMIVLGAIFGNLLASSAGGVSFKPATDTLDTIGFLALFFVMAQAIERLMEPVAELNLRKIGSARKGKENEVEAKVKAAGDSDDSDVRQANANDAANSQAEANQIAANTKVFVWGLASFVAMLVSGATKVFFLEAIGFEGIPNYLNVLITGLVIGGGTKPLHDLIKLIEKKSENGGSGEDASGSDGD